MDCWPVPRDVMQELAIVTWKSPLSKWPRGPMDKASAHGAGDCRFESYRGQAVFKEQWSGLRVHKAKSQLPMSPGNSALWLANATGILLKSLDQYSSFTPHHGGDLRARSLRPPNCVISQ